MSHAYTTYVHPLAMQLVSRTQTLSNIVIHGIRTFKSAVMHHDGRARFKARFVTSLRTDSETEARD
jgi:hypothetical protein